MTWYQEWFGEEYLELYSYRDESEAKEQVAFFRRHVGSLHGPVLDLACGTGRHIAELKCAGYEPVGCDLSYTLLRTGVALMTSLGAAVGGWLSGDAAPALTRLKFPLVPAPYEGRPWFLPFAGEWFQLQDRLARRGGAGQL